MKHFIEKIKEERTPHERRQIAVRAAGVITAIIFVGWIGTLGVRLGNLNANVANNGESNQTAAVGNIPTLQNLDQGSGNTLFVATTTN